MTTKAGSDALALFNKNAAIVEADYRKELKDPQFKQRMPYQAWLSAHIGIKMAASIVMRLSDVMTRLEKIEEKGVVYRGMFNQSDEYQRGDLVSHGGSIFHCTRPTQGVRPTHEGEASKALDHPWQLAVKRGRDARGSE